MLVILWIVLTSWFSIVQHQHELAQEVLALRHQLMVLKQQMGRPMVGRFYRYL